MRKTLPLMALAGVLALASCGKTPTQPQVASTSDIGSGLSSELKSQIVGGVISARGARPYQVALVTSSGSQFCGGTLIHPEWVLTAAHCMGGTMNVRVGANKLSDRTQGQTISVTRTYTHPSYRNVESGYDIALLKLSKPATLDRYTGIAYIPGNTVESILDVAGKTAIVSGWGDTRSGANRGSDDLREVVVPITPNPRVCGDNDTPLPGNTICGNYYQGKDSCQGDSGGPLAQSYNGRMYVLGIVSYGVGCSGDGMYTRVNGYTSWIEQVSGVKADNGGGSTTPTPTPDPEPTPNPDTGNTGSYTYKGTISKGTSAYAPQDGFTLSRAGTLRGELTGPNSADFDLYLEKSNGYYWIQVAKSTRFNNSNESISYNATAGQYRWRVRAWNGSGEATLVQTPRGDGQR